jgi:hypothetical protein
MGREWEIYPADSPYTMGKIWGKSGRDFTIRVDFVYQQLPITSGNIWERQGKNIPKIPNKVWRNWEATGRSFLQQILSFPKGFGG